MNHFALLILCIVSIEILIRLNYLSLIFSTSRICKKAIIVLRNRKISDHWKESAVSIYSLQLIKYSIINLSIVLLILSVFIIINSLNKGFLEFIISFQGIIGSLIISFSYFYIRKYLNK